MNILHHKSYHVYNKKNIEKVKKDEAEAEKQEKAKQDRITLAESEARLNLLRKRANANLPNIEQDIKPTQHINLFQDLAVKGNPEHEQDLKEEKEKWDKQITMYLGKGTNKEDEPWYINKEDNPNKYKDITTFKSKHTGKKKKSCIKLLEDPLDIINTKLKKDKHEKKYKSKKKAITNDSSSIEELRAKRLEREKKEKIRVKQLYLGSDYIEDSEKVITDERKRGYNSQFNRQETEQAHKKRR